MSNQFTTVGMVIFGVVLWTSAQNASGSAQHVINLFLFVLLLSIVLLNWAKISPLFFK